MTDHELIKLIDKVFGNIHFEDGIKLRQEQTTADYQTDEIVQRTRELD